MLVAGARNRQNLPSGGWPHDYYSGVLPQLPVKRGVFRSPSLPTTWGRLAKEGNGLTPGA
jgi:hypothetical protein